MGLSLGKVFKPVGSLLNGITGVTDTANESYKASKRLMGMENANNIALWNMQNEYNTPAAQIARMADAGIDVNPMTYAVGSGSMSSTASSIASSTPHMPNYSGAGNPITSLMSVLGGLEDIESRRLQNKILKKDLDTYEKTGVRPGSDGFSQLARVFATHFPSIIEAIKGKFNGSKESLLDGKLPGESDFDYKHRIRFDYYKKHGKFPD